MPVIRKITDIFAKLRDAAGNGITSTDLGSGKRGLDVNASVPIAVDKVRIRDASNENRMAGVDEAGYLLVKTPAPAAPSGTIPVEMMARSTIAGSASVDQAWVIPSNTILVLQRFLGGLYPSNNPSELGLYYCPTGAIVAASYLISLGYVGAGQNNYSDELSQEYSGNGTIAIVARRRRLDATAREMYYRWIGYLKYNTTTVQASGTVTAVTETLITDSTKAWAVNVHAGRYVIIAGKTPLRIVSNTATALTVIGNSQLTVGEAYQIVTFNA